jgi:hypothetical protein
MWACWIDRLTESQIVNTLLDEAPRLTTTME